LGLRYGARDPWTGLLRVSMGQSTIGRNERAAIINCLDLLMESCQEEISAEAPPPASQSWLQRVKNYFL
jgi:hypothetical protein